MSKLDYILPCYLVGFLWIFVNFSSDLIYFVRKIRKFSSSLCKKFQFIKLFANIYKGLNMLNFQKLGFLMHGYFEYSKLVIFVSVVIIYVTYLSVVCYPKLILYDLWTIFLWLKDRGVWILGKCDCEMSCLLWDREVWPQATAACDELCVTHLLYNQGL